MKKSTEEILQKKIKEAIELLWANNYRVYKEIKR
tara:strand:+ start:221 stop:322 length:102 start_codon:yes stop_codon:yes gene_type:complete